MPDSDKQGMSKLHGPWQPQGVRGLNQWPLLLVLVAMGVGMWLVAEWHWRRGCFVMGAAVGLASLLRFLLPQQVAGLLVVRGRLFDVSVTAFASLAIMVLALVVPGRA